MLYFQNMKLGIIVLKYDTNFPEHAIIIYIYMTLTSRYMTFHLTVYDSVSSGNEIISGDIVFNISIWCQNLAL